jgi:hypothetical protein
MLNITTIQNGFEFNDSSYLFQNFSLNGELVAYEIIGESQVHFGTDKGIILLDLSCTINEVEFTDINLFVSALKGE